MVVSRTNTSQQKVQSKCFSKSNFFKETSSNLLVFKHCILQGSCSQGISNSGLALSIRIPSMYLWLYSSAVCFLCLGLFPLQRRTIQGLLFVKTQDRPSHHICTLSDDSLFRLQPSAVWNNVILLVPTF